MAVKIAHRHICQTLEDVLPHAEGHLSGNGDHQHVEQIGHHRRSQIKPQHSLGVIPHHGHVHLTGACLDGVDGLAGKLRANQREAVGADGQHQRHQQQPFMLPQIAAQPPEGTGFLAHTASPSPICRRLISRYRSQPCSSSSWVPKPAILPSSSTRILSQFFTELTRWAMMMVVVSS